MDHNKRKHVVCFNVFNSHETFICTTFCKLNKSIFFGGPVRYPVHNLVLNNSRIRPVQLRLRVCTMSLDRWFDVHNLYMNFKIHAFRTRKVIRTQEELLLWRCSESYLCIYNCQFRFLAKMQNMLRKSSNGVYETLPISRGILSTNLRQ